MRVAGQEREKKKNQKEKYKYSQLLTPNTLVMGFGVRSSGVKNRIIMDYNNLYGQFSNELWNHFLDSEHSTNRKSATFQQWLKRSLAARQAMSSFLSEHGAPRGNPFFWVKRFPEPQPHNLNGARSMPDEPLVRAIYNGIGGIYTRREAELYNMQIKGEFNL